MRTPRNLKHSAGVLGAGLAALAIASTAAAPGALAASDGDVNVVNTETVQVYVKPDGSVESQRVYEQLTLTGSGTADIANPIEEEGLRNLNEFGSPAVEDGVQSFEVDVDGVERLRSVSDYTGELPLDIDVEYRLDGELVEPGDVVGADGELEVLYTARNITAQPQEVTFPDGHGGTTTETVDVPIPMVGSLTTIAPPNFTEVASDQANMAGDGKGGTKLSFTMTLFPPIGSDTAEFGYTATISDGVVPSSSVSALPVNPLESPSFQTAGKSYQSGSDTGVKLAEGATEIDGHLLELRDGSAKLLAGLIKLSDGADELSAGLAGDAAPGSRKLADGAGELDAGLTKLDDGAGQLSAGAGRLAVGAGQLDDGLGKLGSGTDRLDAGAGRLASGLRKLEGGLTKLYGGVDNLPASVRKELSQNQDYLDLLGALTAIADGVGNRGDAPDAGTLLGGVNAVEFGMRFPGPTDCQVALATPPQEPTKCGALDGVDTVAGVVRATRDLPTNPDDGVDSVAELKAGILQIQATCGAANLLCQGTVAGVADSIGNKLTTNLTKLETSLSGITSKVDRDLLDRDGDTVPEGLNRLRAGLSTGANPSVCATSPKGTCGVKEAALAVRGGIDQLVDKLLENVRGQLLKAIGRPVTGCDPTETLRCAAGALADGGVELSKGVDDLVAGVGLLSAGGDALAAGAGDLSDGAGRLAAGTGDASDGSGRLAEGAGELADGLGKAADGSVRLADGLAEARGGAPALVDGAGRLSEEGMSKLIGAGEDTAQDYGKLYATIEAGAVRADAEKMAYGAPEDAQGLTAYTYEMLGDDGDSGRNTKRGLAALGLLGVGAGAFFLRRRFI